MNNIAFELFGLKIHWYGIFYVLTFLVGYFFLYIIGKKGILKGVPSVHRLIEKGLDDLMIAVILGVLIGGRLAHVLLYNFGFYLENPLKIFAIWEGGMGFVGGVIGVLIGIYFVIRKYKLGFRDFLILTDLICVVLPFGILVGRIGNFLNQELIGKPLSFFNNNAPTLGTIFEISGLTTVYETADQKVRINNNIVESILQGGILLVINLTIFIKTYIKKPKPGLISGIFLVGYGIFRFLTEIIRDYGLSEYVGIMTKTQYFMIVFIIFGGWLIYKANKNN